jgi:hypothetical protein
LIKVKWGQCPDCEPGGKDKPMVNKRCKYHNERHKHPAIEEHEIDKAEIKEVKPKKPRKAINKVSKNEAARQRKYYKIRTPWILIHDLCEMRLVNDCTYFATEVHHGEGRLGDLLFDTSKWVAGCHNCHHHAEMNVTEAKEKSISFNRISNEQFSKCNNNNGNSPDSWDDYG